MAGPYRLFPNPSALRLSDDGQCADDFSDIGGRTRGEIT